MMERVAGSIEALKSPAEEYRFMRVKRFFRREPSLLGVISLGLVPWLAVAVFTAGVWTTVNLLVYALVVLTSGYAVVGATLRAEDRGIAILLAPATGILIISSATALWVRLGLPIAWSWTLWITLTAAGVGVFWRKRIHPMSSVVPYGKTLVLLSALICVVYFLPSARNDLIQRSDGGFQWMFIDSQHFHGITAAIKNSGSPPSTPGTITAPLLYHFAPYAPAATLSRVSGLDLGDAEVRITRGASLWALVLSCFAVGTLLSIKATGSRFGGLASVIGLFFYGSMAAVFTKETTTLGHLAKALLFNIPKLEVAADGGPFNQLLGGHSVLHGLGAITAITGICLMRRTETEESGIRDIAILALPAVAVPVNLEVSIYCLGVVSILLFWGRLKSIRSWLSIILAMCLFLISWSVMGYSHSSDAGLAKLNLNLAQHWWAISVWFIVGLGFRLIAFRWISRPLRDPVSALILVSVVGWLAFALLINLRDENERYGFYFLQSILSIFAFSRLAPGWWRRTELAKMIGDWLRIATKLMIGLLACGIAARFAIYLMHSQTWVASLRFQLLPFIVVLGLISGALVLMKRTSRFSQAISVCVLGVLLIGFLAWLPTWIRFGLQTVPTTVVYPSAEVSGLHRLRELMAPADRFATNKHNIDRISPLPPLALSYGYSALAEHPVLLEGYLARGEDALPWFKKLDHDNDLLFATTDAETLHRIAKTWNVRWLVARPGTDIAIPRPLPPWLIEQQNSGDLKIYRVD